MNRWIKGALIGAAVWVACAGIGRVNAVSRGALPNVLKPIQWAGELCLIAAFPVGTIGWIAIWGDKGAPVWWLDSFAFNIAAGLCLWATIGAALYVAIPAMREGRAWRKKLATLGPTAERMRAEDERRESEE